MNAMLHFEAKFSLEGWTRFCVHYLFKSTFPVYKHIYSLCPMPDAIQNVILNRITFAVPCTSNVILNTTSFSTGHGARCARHECDRKHKHSVRPASGVGHRA
jgi:hypothetical protein